MITLDQKIATATRVTSSPIIEAHTSMVIISPLVKCALGWLDVVWLGMLDVEDAETNVEVTVDATNRVDVPSVTVFVSTEVICEYELSKLNSFIVIDLCTAVLEVSAGTAMADDIAGSMCN